MRIYACQFENSWTAFCFANSLDEAKTLFSQDRLCADYMIRRPYTIGKLNDVAPSIRSNSRAMRWLHNRSMINIIDAQYRSPFK